VFDRIVNQANDAIIVAEINPAEGPGFRIIYTNEAFTRVFGYSSKEVLGESPRMLQGPGTCADTIKEISSVVHQGTSIRRRVLNYTKSGQPIWVDVNIVPLPNHDGSVNRFAAIERDVTTEVQREHQLEELAFADPLTKLANRRYFEQTLEKEVARARRSNQDLSLAILNIDHFKQVNDTWGHPVGDRVLVAVVRSMLQSVRNYDSVARIGGEEFTVLLPGASAADGIRIVERLRADIGNNAHVVVDTQKTTVTCSAGLTSLNGSFDTVEELMAAADRALYRAKDAGRDRIAIASATGFDSLGARSAAD
jgi:diguanylate cyclase (GGDEF)-like protein/PAS domain S-box-containing protein